MAGPSSNWPSASAGNSSWTNSTSGSSGNSTSQWQNSATDKYLQELNHTLSTNYIWALFAVAVAVTAYRCGTRINNHIRHLASMNNTAAQKYFATSSTTVSWIKDQLLYAPVLYHRRATELKFSERITLGTLPTRFQALFIGAFVIFNIFACTWNIPWSDPQLQVLPILRNRTGTLSVVNCFPILVMATIKNPLIYFLDIPYDTFNLMHRWLGRLSVLQAIAHTLCWMIAKVQKAGWSGVKESLAYPFIYYGMAATIGFTVLMLHSPKLLRSLAYELFLYTHFIVVALSFAFLWIHLDGFPQQRWLLAAILVWAGARAWRFGTLIYRSVGGQGCKAVIEAMPGDALRISVTPARPWKVQPGQSLFLTIPAVGWLTAHPFSVAWSGYENNFGSENLATLDEKTHIARQMESDPDKRGKQTISLVVKAKSGMTKHLYERAIRAGGLDGNRVNLNAMIEGPYGRETSLSSYGTVMLFASGVGITHQMPYVKQLVEGYANGIVATRKITLVWLIPDTECLEWIRPWMHEILALERRREILKILLHITRANLSQSIKSPSESVKMLRGRPHVESLMKTEAREKMGCMGVTVCAGGGLADEVRRVSRILVARGINVDFMEEGFGW